MIKIAILTPGFITPNSYGFLYPFYRFKKNFNDQKFNFNIYKNHNSVKESDYLILDSKYFGLNYWRKNKKNLGINIIKTLSKRTNQIIYYDNSDSTGWIHEFVLPYVHKYAKSQLLKNKELYSNEIYNNRIYCDYYYRKFNISNTKKSFSVKINKTERQKFRLGWNSGYANYNYFGNVLMKMNRYLNIQKIYEKKIKFIDKNIIHKKNYFFLRMGLTYHHQTIIFHRNLILDFFKNNLLYKNFPSKKINRSNYFKELSNSLISISPFGLGEITLKDFESFISGSILFKPNMNHMETFPNIYVDNISTIFFDWNTNNLEEKIDLILSDLEFSKSLISNSQKIYNHYMNTEEGSFDFIENFKKILN